MADEKPLKTPIQVQRERRLQTWLLGLASALLVIFVAWCSNQFLTLIRNSDRSIDQNARMSAQIDLLYSANEAHRDFSETNGRIDANQRRIDSNEGRQQNFEIRLDRVEHIVAPRASK